METAHCATEKSKNYFYRDLLLQNIINLKFTMLAIFFLCILMSIILSYVRPKEYEARQVVGFHKAIISGFSDQFSLDMIIESINQNSYMPFIAKELRLPDDSLPSFRVSATKSGGLLIVANRVHDRQGIDKIFSLLEKIIREKFTEALKSSIEFKELSIAEKSKQIDVLSNKVRHVEEQLSRFENQISGDRANKFDVNSSELLVISIFNNSKINIIWDGTLKIMKLAEEIQVLRSQISGIEGALDFQPVYIDNNARSKTSFIIFLGFAFGLTMNMVFVSVATLLQYIRMQNSNK